MGAVALVPHQVHAAFGTYAAGEGEKFYTPMSYKWDGTQSAIIAFHGNGSTFLQPGDATAGGVTSYLNAILAPCLAAGFPVYAIDAGVSSFTVSPWGNDQSNASTGLAYARLIGALKAKANSVILLGASMGGTSCRNWARANVAKVRAILGLCPATDVKGIRDGNLGSLQATINTSMGLATPVAPTVSLGAAGVLTGVYRYRYTFVSAAGESPGGTVSATVSPSAQQVSIIAIAAGLANVVTGRNLYRTAAGGAAGTEKLVATIADNTTTTFTDNLADGSLGANYPATIAITDAYYDTHSPSRYAATLAPIPQRYWYGAADGLVLPASITAYQAASVAAGATDCTSTAMAGIGHDTTALDPDTLRLALLALP